MIFFHEKGKDVIKKAAEGATAGLICTPYYSERGLALLDPFFDVAEKVDFWTRFSPLDWRAGVADMAELLVEKLQREKLQTPLCFSEIRFVGLRLLSYLYVIHKKNARHLLFYSELFDFELTQCGG